MRCVKQTKGGFVKKGRDKNEKKGGGMIWRKGKRIGGIIYYCEYGSVFDIK